MTSVLAGVNWVPSTIRLALSLPVMQLELWAVLLEALVWEVGEARGKEEEEREEEEEVELEAFEWRRCARLNRGGVKSAIDVDAAFDPVTPTTPAPTAPAGAGAAGAASESAFADATTPPDLAATAAPTGPVVPDDGAVVSTEAEHVWSVLLLLPSLPSHN